MKSIYLLLFLVLVSFGFTAEKPNIVVIMVDDPGYSDLGCYGGEIETPNLYAPAADGLRFSQFYNTAKCHSSRVSLLTGQYCLAAGDVTLSHAVTSAEVLGDAGYFTAMTGKWHVDREPTDFGFQRYFGHLSGATSSRLAPFTPPTSKSGRSDATSRIWHDTRLRCRAPTRLPSLEDVSPAGLQSCRR